MRDGAVYLTIIRGFNRRAVGRVAVAVMPFIFDLINVKIRVPSTNSNNYTNIFGTRVEVM